MAAGPIASQQIWVTYNGQPTTRSLAELNGMPYEELIKYKIYYVHPETFEPATLPVDGIASITNQQVVRITNEDGGQVTLAALGGLMDIDERDPVHLTVNFPSNTRYLVGAETDGRPGTRHKLVRSNVKWEHMLGTVMTVKSPNVISDSFYIIIL